MVSPFFDSTAQAIIKQKNTLTEGGVIYMVPKRRRNEGLFEDFMKDFFDQDKLFDFNYNPLKQGNGWVFFNKGQNYPKANVWHKGENKYEIHVQPGEHSKDDIKIYCKNKRYLVIEFQKLSLDENNDKKLVLNEIPLSANEKIIDFKKTIEDVEAEMKKGYLNIEVTLKEPEDKSIEIK